MKTLLWGVIWCAVLATGCMKDIDDGDLQNDRQDVLEYEVRDIDPGEDVDMVLLNPQEIGGAQAKFKVPIPKGYDWEITQSWSSHCSICNQRGYDATYGDYCSNSTHLGSCCNYGWDFNLPGVADDGKPALASGNGVVKFLGEDGDWGETVIIDHGNNICTRYAHLQYDSNDHLQVGQSVCQGLQIGRIGGSPHWPSHLHFQFESCDTAKPLEMAFTDGNGIPVCTLGDDIYNTQGAYDFLLLTNDLKTSCEGETSFGGGDLPSGGWVEASCGAFSGCPLIPNCGRSSGHEFSDQYLLSESTKRAAQYLYSECALDGKIDGALHPFDLLSRAEALKIGMFLFGLNYYCTGFEPESFLDVRPEDWFRDVVACAQVLQVIDHENDYFRPNDQISFPEAATMMVTIAARAGVIQLEYDNEGHFARIGLNHWAYPFVETLYHHGGAVVDRGVVDDSYGVRRWEYVEMAAALSPCFCGNVNCEDDCACDQSLMACVDPNDPGPEIGGGDPPPIDVKMDCEVFSGLSYCDAENERVYVACELRNAGARDVNVKQVFVEFTDGADLSSCSIVRMSDLAGIVPAGASRTLEDGFELNCTEMPWDEDIDLDFQILERWENSDVLHENIEEDQVDLSDKFSCPSDPLTGTVIIEGWECDLALGYDWVMSGIGLSYELATSGSIPYSTGSVNGDVTLHLECADLPAALVVQSGMGTEFSLMKGWPDLPNMNVWDPHNGQPEIYPSASPNYTVTGAQGIPPYWRMMFRVPPL